MEPYSIIYILDFPGKPFTFKIPLDPKTINYIGKEALDLPDWTKLEYQQCSNCPLKPETSPRCPVAVNLHDLLKQFKDMKSYVEVMVKVGTVDRVMMKKVPVQIALFSIFGLIMATSGCPRMDFMKPMARFHLPFATQEESLLRSITFYLLRQHYAAQAGAEPDPELTGLDELYQEVQKVNQGIYRRLSGLKQAGDADKNALILLDALSQTLSVEIKIQLESLKYLFD